MENITDILTIVLLIIGGFTALTFVIYLYRKSDTEGRLKIIECVRIFVEAAEQLYQGRGRGAEKKQYVIDSLKKLGLPIDGDKLDAFIEAAVYELNSSLDYIIMKETEKEG